MFLSRRNIYDKDITHEEDKRANLKVWCKVGMESLECYWQVQPFKHTATGVVNKLCTMNVWYATIDQPVNQIAAVL